MRLCTGAHILAGNAKVGARTPMATFNPAAGLRRHGEAGETHGSAAS